MKKILFFVCLLNQVYAQSIVNVQLPVAAYTISASSPNTPASYQWYEVPNTLQGVNIFLPPTEAADIYLQQNNARLAFNVLYSGSFMFKLELNYDNQGYQTAHQELSGFESYGWIDPPAFFKTIGNHNLKVRYGVLPSGDYIYREYNVKVVPDCSKYYKENGFGNDITLFENNNVGIKKPILIVEGFDPTNVDYPEFYRDRADALINQLLAENYKVYMLDLSLNGQDMRNNAAVVHSAINYLSSINNNQQVVAGGISMGGVILRYCLAKAEHNGINLPVSHFITFDSPHQEAIISKELQLYMQSAPPNYSLGTTAAKQLLLYNVYDQNNTHASFYNELNALNGDGYPHNPINIGVAFSSDLPNPNPGAEWLKVLISPVGPDHYDYINDEESLPGSYLPASSIVRDPFYVLWNVATATITRNLAYNPTFIPYTSALDMVGGQSKFCITLETSKTDLPNHFYHDRVPPGLVDPIVKALRSINLNTIASGTYYNFTDKTGNVVLNNLDVYGKLRINNNVASGSSLNPGLLPEPNSTFRVMSSCRAQYINVYNSSEVIIGDNSVNNKGEFIVHSGTVLNLKQGAKLSIKNDSKLVIEPGATLVYEPGAIIELIGSNSVLEVQGTLELKPGAVLTYTGNGFLRFKNTNSNSVVMGTNSKISITQTGQTDKAIEVIDGTLYGSFGSGRKFEVMNAKIELTNATLDIASELKLTNVWVNGGNGLVTNGQFPITISDCKFSNNVIGINAFQSGGNGAPITVNSTFFQNCGYGIKVYDKGVNLYGCIFDYAPVKLENLIFNSEIKYTTIDDSYDMPYLSALSYSGSTSPSLFLEHTNITNSYIGLHTNNTLVNMKCSNIGAFYTCIDNVNAITNLAGNLYGRNSFYQTEESDGLTPVISITDAKGLALNGTNKIHKRYYTSKYIGRLVPQTLSLNAGYMDQINTTINAVGNKWYPETGVGNTAPVSSDFLLGLKTYIQYNPIASGTAVDNFCMDYSPNVVLDDVDFVGDEVLDNCTECNSVVYKKEPIHSYLKKLINEAILSGGDVENNVRLFNEFDELIHYPVSARLNKVYKVQRKAFEYYDNVYAKLLYNHLVDKKIDEKLFDECNQKYYRTIDHLFRKADEQKDTTTMFNAILSKSYGLLANDQFDEALLNIREANPFARVSEEKDHIERFNCIVSAEQSYLKGLITKSEFSEIMESCPTVGSRSKMKLTENKSRKARKTFYENIVSDELKIYPNPVDQILYLDLDLKTSQVVSVYLFDLTGRMIKSFYDESELSEGIHQLSMDTKELKPGVYTVVYKTSSKTQTKKVVVIN